MGAISKLIAAVLASGLSYLGITAVTGGELEVVVGVVVTIATGLATYFSPKNT